MTKHSFLVCAASWFPEKDFPLSVYQVPHHTPIDLHHHEFHEIVVILAGSARHITDRESYTVEAGDVFLIRGDMSHAYADTKDVTLVNIPFDPQRLRLPLADLDDVPGYHALFRVEPKLRGYDKLRGRLRLTADELAETAQLIAKLQRELSRKEPGYRFAARTHLMYIITYLSRCYTRGKASKRQPVLRIGEVLSFIAKHYQEPISVAQLARIAHMSERSLMRTFRKVMGRSPVDHVIRVRIGKASNLLRNEDIRVTEAAFQCGFNDSSYFSRQFRRITGRSPREFRRFSDGWGPRGTGGASRSDSM